MRKYRASAVLPGTAAFASVALPGTAAFVVGTEENLEIPSS